jgi:hypothetical protein
MHTELKKAIIDYIFQNPKEHQLNHATTEKFKAYIFDSEGNYLIGGPTVTEFIFDAIQLITRP